MVEYSIYRWLLKNKFSDEEYNKWIKVFESYKKLDDMSDVFCYCIASK